MLKNICRACNGEMTRKYTGDGVTLFCESCEGETEYDQVEMECYCPDCGNVVAICIKCGAQGYFCSECNSAKSSKKIIWKRV